MVVVTDASPVIFLGKIHCLDLVRKLFTGALLVPGKVHDEILSPGLPPDEERELLSFLSGCEVVKVVRPRQFATGLSPADNAALTLAARRAPAVLLADDHLVREVARLEDIRTVGTLGILLHSCREGHVDAERVRELIGELIQRHRFRISIELYQAVLEQLSGM